MRTLTLEKSSLTRDFTLVLLGSLMICLSGQIAIPLWFTPIPITLQNAAVLLVAALLGARRGTAATFAFLAQGALGLPVFSNGAGGFLCLVGPSGGYLIGYLIASYIVGTMMDKKKSPITALAVGNIAIYLCGASYLATFIGVSKAFLLGIAPFLLGDFLKTLASLKILQWKSVQ